MDHDIEIKSDVNLNQISEDYEDYELLSQKLADVCNNNNNDNNNDCVQPKRLPLGIDKTDDKFTLISNLIESSKKFEADEIEPGLFLGSFAAASNADELSAQQIGCVLSIGISLGNISGLLDYDRFIIADDPQSDLKQFFDRGITFIERNLQRNEKVLVHCLAGISRSATIVAAYLIKKYKINADQALSIIAQRRRIIDPNSGFRKQLAQFASEQLLK
jgi:protein-tyrosine phosphatase